MQEFLFDRYIIERKDISHASSTWECVQTTDDTSVTVRKFNPTKDYLFRLRAENDFGVSDPSMSVSYYGKRGESFFVDFLLFVTVCHISLVYLWSLFMFVIGCLLPYHLIMIHVLYKY